MVAPQDPLLCSTAEFTNEEIAEALDDPRVLGMGEIVSWLRLLQCDEEFFDSLELAHRKRPDHSRPHRRGARSETLRRGRHGDFFLP